MNLLLGAASLSTHRSGVGRMTLEIARAVRHTPGVDALRLLVGRNGQPAEYLDALPEPMPDRGGASPLARLASIPGLRAARDLATRRWMAREAALLPANGAPTLYYEPNMIANPYDGPTVAGFNDLSWLHHPEAHPADRVAWIRRRLPGTLRQAARFVAISAFTAQDMVAALGIAPDRIDVVPLAPAAAFAPIDAAAAAPVLARHGLHDRAYVLSVSTLEPRKNFDRLVAAWSALPAATRRAHPLAIVGARGWGRVLAGPVEGVRLLGHVADAELAALYARCAVFAYVSLYEGFGLPLLEAMAAGAPVVASSTTACGEVAGEAALQVEPQDVASIAGALQAVLDDPAAAARMRAAGTAHASTFSWARTAAALVACWRRALLH